MLSHTKRFNNALQKADVLQARLRPVALGQLQYGVGHVEAVCEAGGTNTARREEHVDAPSAAQVEHALPWFEFSQRCRIPTAERGQRSSQRYRPEFRLGVEI